MSKSLGMLECEVRHGTQIQFTGSTGIYQYHNELIPVLEIKYDLFPIHRFRRTESESNKYWLKVDEIESLKTEKFLELSWKSPGMTFSCFCMNSGLQTLNWVFSKLGPVVRN